MNNTEIEPKTEDLNSFVTYLERDTFNQIMTKFFQVLGYMDERTSVDIERASVDLDEDTVTLSGAVNRETTQ